MRVLYLHQYFVAPSGSGGTRSYEMARRLVKAGHDVALVTSSAFLDETWAPSPGWHRHDLGGIRIEVLQVPYSNRMPFSERVKAFLKFALGASAHVRKLRADVIFATSTPLTIAIPACVAKFYQRIPMVFEVRDLWPEVPIAVGALRNPVARWLARLMEWLAYHSAAHVVALSPGIAQGVQQRGIPASKISVIPNSCDVDLFDVAPSCADAIRQRLNLEDNQPLVLYAGTFGLVNGVGYLIEAAAAMRSIAPEVRFLLVGDGIESEKLTAQAHELGVLNENLWIWPPVPKMEMPAVLAAATVATSLFIPLSSMWSNSANKFFDALASAKPVVINYGGWQAELLEETGAGLVLPPDNPAHAATQLASFLHDTRRVQRASAASRHLAYTRFHRDAMADKLERILLEVAGKPRDVSR